MNQDTDINDIIVKLDERLTLIENRVSSLLSKYKDTEKCVNELLLGHSFADTVSKEKKGFITMLHNTIAEPDNFDDNVRLVF